MSLNAVCCLYLTTIAQLFCLFVRHGEKKGISDSLAFEVTDGGIQFVVTIPTIGFIEGILS